MPIIWMFDVNKHNWCGTQSSNIVRRSYTYEPHLELSIVQCLYVYVVWYSYTEIWLAYQIPRFLFFQDFFFCRFRHVLTNLHKSYRLDILFGFRARTEVRLICFFLIVRNVVFICCNFIFRLFVLCFEL